MKPTDRIVKIGDKGYYALPGESDDDVRARHARIQNNERAMHGYTAEELFADPNMRRQWLENGKVTIQ